MDPITREGLIDRYVRFLDEGYLDGIEPILEAARNDPELRALITEVNRAYAEEAGLLTALDAKIHTLYPLESLAQRRRVETRSATRLPMRLVWRAVAVAAALLIGIAGGRYLLAPSSSPAPATRTMADLTPHATELARLAAYYRGLVRSTHPAGTDSSHAAAALNRLILARSIDQLLSIDAQAVWSTSQVAKLRETVGELREVYAVLSRVAADAEPMRAHAAFLLANAALMLGDTDEARYWLSESLEMQEWKEEAQSLLARLDAVTE